jgi:hypothetical protein
VTHSGVYSTGLTVAGDDWTRTDGRIFARVTSGLYDGLEVRGVDYTIPGTAGQVPFGRLAHQRMIAAEGMVMGAGADESAQRADFMVLCRALGDTMRGDHDPYTIVVTLEDGSTATISARPLRIEWGPDDLPTYREFLAYWLAVGDASAPTAPDWVFSGDGS